MERTASSDAALGRLLDDIAVLVAGIDPQGRILFVSEAARAILDRDPEELVGTDTLELIHPADRDEAARRMRGEGADDDNDQQVLVRVMRPDDTYVWLQAGGRMQVDPDTGERSIALVGFEATAHVEADRERERTEARFRELIEWLPAVVYEAEPGPDGRCAIARGEWSRFAIARS